MIDRRQSQVQEIANLREPGGFELPAEIVRRLDTFSALREIQGALVPPEHVHPQEFARTLIASLDDGGEVDVRELATDLLAARQEAARVEVAQQILTEALELASSKAGSVSREMANEVVTAHLQPAYADVLAEAVKIGPTLVGVNLDNGWRAAPAVRKARDSFVNLADRYTAIRRARQLTFGLAGVAPEWDHQHLFGQLRYPERVLARRGVTGLDSPNLPKEPLPLLLELATTYAAAEPWLPTFAQQDQRWLDLFGGDNAARQQRNVATRAYAGQRV